MKFLAAIAWKIFNSWRVAHNKKVAHNIKLTKTQQECLRKNWHFMFRADVYGLPLYLGIEDTSKVDLTDWRSFPVVKVYKVTLEEVNDPELLKEAEIMRAIQMGHIDEI